LVDPDVCEPDAADGHANGVRRHFAFDFDHAADPSDDSRASVEQLMRRGTGRRPRCVPSSILFTRD
jgi:hypothetical protein